MTRNDVPGGKAQCDIRLQIDGEVEVSVDPSGVFIHNFSGQQGRDDGSECNAPLPGGEPQGFRFDVIDQRGQIRLVEPPTLRNGGRALVRIKDDPNGYGRFHFRLSWALGTGMPPPPPPNRRDVRDGRDNRRGRVNIVSAQWGAGRQTRDVTQLLQSRARDGRIEMRVSNDDIGFDPAPNRVKVLTVTYEIGGQRQTVRVNENDTLRLP